MSSPNRSESWTAVALDALWWLRPMFWAAIALVLWFAVVAPAQADTFPFPPPNTGCPSNTSCIPGGPGAGNPGQCTPNPNGNPGCDGAGNPIDIITGNKYQHEIDLAPLPGEMALHFSRHYNSNSTHRGLAGVGWRSSFEVVLVDLGSAVQIIDADGRRLTFDRKSTQPSLCVGARPEDGRVIVDDSTKEATDRKGASAATKTRGLTYRWQRLDGSEYVFSGGSGEGHPLQSIRAASGATMTLTYLGGALDNVRDALGRTLRFVYARPAAAGSTRHRMLTLSAIDTPVGRVTYRHDEFGRLQAAMQPNGLVHRYHYESERQGASHNTWALTGVSVEWVQDGKISTERLATYVYDAQGRAVRTQHAGADDLTLAYGPKAATTITTAAGARTVYRHALVAGQWKTVEAIGPGCATCPPSNVRYRYRIDGPQAGQLEATLRLDEQGKPLQQERVSFDAWGRPTRVERVSYLSDRTSKQPQKPELLLRALYEAMPQNPQSAELSAAQYAALWRPTLVARPSVVAGREHTVAFTYNAHLQPMMKTEAGASPLDGVGNLVPTGLTRTTSYRYAQIAGVSRLTSIDGPLPGRADTTTLHYDELGSLRLVQHPVPDLQERFTYDEAGRITWHMPVDAIETRTVYPGAIDSLANRHWLPASISRGGRSSSYRYNVRGWLVRWADGPQKVIELAYDSHGRVIEAKDAEGWRVAINKDQGKQLEATLWYAPGSNDPLRGWYRWFDGSGRTTRTLTPDGRIDDFLYDAQGRTSEHIDGDGVAHSYRQSRDGQRHARIDWAPDDQLRFNVWQADANQTLASGVPAPVKPTTNAGAPQSLRDDFGRVVRVNLPDHGARTARYDAADRFEQIRFVDGATVTYEHDAAGRLKTKLVREPEGTASQHVQLRYHGAYLVEVNDDVQNTAYRYDSAGRRIETRITLLAQPQHTYTIGTVFDANGEPLTQRLADGRSLLIQRDPGTGRAQSIRLEQRGLRQDTTLISGIESHALNGVTRFTHGNGVATARSHDTAGRLTALKVDGVVDLTYEYGAGPRIRAIKDGDGASGRPSARTALHYDGFGALKTAAIARPTTTAPLTPSPQQNGGRNGLVRTSVSLPITSVATLARDLRGRLIADQRFDYRYDALDRLIAVHERPGGRVIARYAYNAFGERASKTVIEINGTAATSYFLYQRQRLVAEIGASGAVGRQYVYLNGSPVAAVDRERLLAIHTDHRGAPLAMTDEKRRIVWKAGYRDAWGQVQTIEANETSAPAWKQQLHRASFGLAGEVSLSSAQLRLRLPGQYEDEETGLHYNVHRYYDARTQAGNLDRMSEHNFVNSHARGRYLTPDPLGYPDGPDSYVYASGDPINKIDPLGLYEIDVHFYMTFFLARIAGIGYEEALTIALAAQFIDDNALTKPVPPLNWDLVSESDYEAHNNRLRLYHFMEGLTNSSGTLQGRVQNPQSAQLTNLRSASARAPTRCARAQFLGEFLHAFQDTFSHRDQNNIPIGLNIGGVIGFPNTAAGHTLWGHSPDYTFNHSRVIPQRPWFIRQPGQWFNNESRSLRMELEVFEQLSAYSGKAFVNSVTGGAISNSITGQALKHQDLFSDTVTNPGWLVEWNRLLTETEKIFYLEEKLRLFGLGALPLYSLSDGQQRRDRNLCGLRQVDYQGTILPNTACPRT